MLEGFATQTKDEVPFPDFILHIISENRWKIKYSKILSYKWESVDAKGLNGDHARKFQREPCFSF